jgi:hypothetical protein
MIPVKTPAGQQVLKDRSVPLTLRQRAALIVIDGRRTLTELLQGSGVTAEDLQHLFQLGLVAETGTAAGLGGGEATAPAPLRRA